MQSSLERTLSITLTIATVVIAGILVHREFFARSANSLVLSTGPSEPEYIANWAEFLPSGILVGEDTAQVKVVVFSDLECPFCSRFHQTFRRAQQRFGKSVALVFLHYPLAGHRFAKPAARAAECALPEGRFGELLDVIFAKQDSLGLKSWASYADEASIADTLGFARCASDTARVARIDAGQSLGNAIPIPGTPTVIVNGWHLPGTPSDSLLSSTIEALMAGRSPIGRRPSS